MISIIHPSRGRPEKSYNNINYWYKHYSGRPEDLEIIVSIDNSDPLYHEYKKYHSEHVISNDNTSAVDAINNAAKIASGDIFIIVSDDTRSFPGWSREIYEAIKGRGIDWMLKTQDAIQDYIITMPIMDRAYYNRTGYIYHPEFQHLFCDTYLTCVADITGRKITSNLMFKHDHYSVNGTEPDDLHKRNDATWKQGQETFIRLMKQFTPQERARIKDPGMRSWLRNHGV